MHEDRRRGGLQRPVQRWKMRTAETIETNDNHHLTDQGIAAREALLEEIEAIEQDLEAIEQEHGLD